MARVASGKEVLEQAKGLPVNAKTIEESRQAQAVVLPLEFGLSMEQTATAIGTSIGWACQFRRRLIRNGGMRDTTKLTRGGRRRQNLSREEEVAFLAPFIEKASAGGILIVSEIKQALDTRLKRKTSLAATYSLLHRHGWRKLAPDKRHPKADVLAQDE
ncbi:Winged helix-turn helix [Nitrosomonas sp. Nm34]|nr:Winged helix-turn helix [Nitrosomonas sp. Nm34]